MQVPDRYLLNQDAAELGQRIKLSAALFMFRSGELSAGAAAELAEVDRFTFAAECNRHGIPVVDYPSEDLETEMAALRASDLDELVAAGAVRLGNSGLPAELWNLPKPEDPDDSVRRAILEERAGGTCRAVTVIGPR